MHVKCTMICRQIVAFKLLLTCFTGLRLMNLHCLQWRFCSESLSISFSCNALVCEADLTPTFRGGGVGGWGADYGKLWLLRMSLKLGKATGDLCPKISCQLWNCSLFLSSSGTFVLLLTVYPVLVCFFFFFPSCSGLFLLLFPVSF